MRSAVYFTVVIVFLISGCMQSVSRQDSPKQRPSHDFHIKNLRDLTQAELVSLKKEVDVQDVYIFVHPSYYVFFHKKYFEISPTPEKNAVQCFLDDTRVEDDSLMSLMRIYEQAEIDFLATASAAGRLVVLLIPGNYDASRLYSRAYETDEYARYINEVTKDSNSVFFIETRRFDTGKIQEDDLAVLIGFLDSLNVQNIFLGGGYIGRCQEEFYQSLRRQWPQEDIALIPELSAISPDDISSSVAKMLLTSEHELNVWAVNYFITNGGLKSLQSKIKIKNLTRNSNSNR